jgi:tetratricopeptide (TPR) repeat protein
MSRAQVFQSSFSLWTDAIDKNFYSWMVHDNMGHAWNSMWQSEPDRSPLKGVYERQAEVEYRIAERLAEPGVVDVHWGLTGFYLKQNRLDEAEAECDQALKIVPGFALAWCAKGDIMKQRGMTDEAMALYRQSAELDAGLADPHARLGLVYEFDRHDDADAEAEYRLAIARDPNQVNVHYNLGNILLRKKSYPEAIDQYRMAMSIESNHPEALCNMAAAYFAMGKTDQAVACAQAAVALDPNNQVAARLLNQLMLARPLR